MNDSDQQSESSGKEEPATAPESRASTALRLGHIELDDGSKLQCICPEGLAINEGDRCVAERGNILEFGRLLRVREATEEPEMKDVCRVLRRATLQDQSRARENELHLKMATETCTRKAKEHKLDMQIVSVRLSFDRKVVSIAYTSKERIQFRDMVGELASALHARIEMKQIGVRDAARIAGGMGPCGRELCCCSWLQEFAAVSVRMAKNQRLSLNPNTISGVCGRLKCCLRYENECYSELGRGLPREGTRVVCPAGNGRVIDKNILAHRIKIRMDDDRILEFGAEEVTAQHS